MMRLRKVKPVRVVATQVAAGTDVTQNLATALAMIDRASEVSPDLVVLPEFMNHASWYEGGPSHCASVSVPLEGSFLQAIQAKARAYRTFVVVNCSLLEGDRCTGTSLLYDRSGRLVGRSDKQVLMGHENDMLVPAAEASSVVSTEIGRIGLYSCMDGVIFETPRGLAVGGAQILVNSLNSFAFDEAALHVPVRAAENKVFVVASNKVGPLVPNPEAVSRMTGIPAHFLHGAGESQIVAPDGMVLARAPAVGATFVFADIDPSEANDKRRPDGTDVFAARRPELYGPLAKPATTALAMTETPERVTIATYQGPDGRSAIDAATHAMGLAAEAGVKLVVLPELFGLGPKLSNPVDALARAEGMVECLTRACASHGIHVALSTIRRANTGLEHAGLVLGPTGVVLAQPQLHRSERHASWVTQLGDKLAIAALPFGRVALAVGEDTAFPETFRLAALAGAELVLAPFHAEERWETELGLLERAAENRLCIVAATRPTAAGTSLIATLEEDFTLMSSWKSRVFDAQISRPIVTRSTAKPGLNAAEIHPMRTHNKVLSHRTHLIENRPWRLASALVARASTPEPA